jgi:hypothetical protein
MAYIHSNQFQAELIRALPREKVANTNGNDTKPDGLYVVFN